MPEAVLNIVTTLPVLYPHLDYIITTQPCGYSWHWQCTLTGSFKSFPCTVTVLMHWEQLFHYNHLSTMHSCRLFGDLNSWSWRSLYATIPICVCVLEVEPMTPEPHPVMSYLSTISNSMLLNCLNMELTLPSARPWDGQQWYSRLSRHVVWFTSLAYYINRK